MSIQSIAAVQNCMEDLGLHRSEKQEFKIAAYLWNPKTKAGGNIDVVFKSNNGDSQGPYLEFNDTIKGFGIRYTQFRPKFLDVVYDKTAKELTVTGQDYEFILTFNSQGSDSVSEEVENDSEVIPNEEE